METAVAADMVAAVAVAVTNYSVGPKLISVKKLKAPDSDWELFLCPDANKKKALPPQGESALR